MTTNPYNEDHLVEQPALALVAELGWQTACGLEETFSPEGGSFGRRDRREVVLLPRLRAALERLNPGQPPEAISASIQKLSHNRSAISLLSVFAHIEQAYPERDRSVYSLAGLSSPPQ
jgi:type I restriction enzyme R subunit